MLYRFCCIVASLVAFATLSICVGVKTVNIPRFVGSEAIIEFCNFTCSAASALNEVVAAADLPVIIPKYSDSFSFPVVSDLPNFSVSLAILTVVAVNCPDETSADLKDALIALRSLTKPGPAPTPAKPLLRFAICVCSALIWLFTDEKSPRATIFNSIRAMYHITPIIIQESQDLHLCQNLLAKPA